MADVPDMLVLKRHRDLDGMLRSGHWVRRAVIAALTAFSILGLLNAFGQRPTTIRASVPEATMSVYAPTALRGGDFMEARFHITAKQDIKKAQLVLDPG